MKELNQQSEIQIITKMEPIPEIRYAEDIIKEEEEEELKNRVDNKDGVLTMETQADDEPELDDDVDEAELLQGEINQDGDLVIKNEETGEETIKKLKVPSPKKPKVKKPIQSNTFDSIGISNNKKTGMWNVPNYESYRFEMEREDLMSMKYEVVSHRNKFNEKNISAPTMPPMLYNKEFNNKPVSKTP
jgi:hypothetical protein